MARIIAHAGFRKPLTKAQTTAKPEEKEVIKKAAPKVKKKPAKKK